LSAVLYSLRLEQLSSLVESIKAHQLSRLTGGQELDEEMVFQAAQPHVYTLRHSSSAEYKIEAEVNYQLGLTMYDLYQSCADNTVYAGKSSLSSERRVRYEAAEDMKYRHCKIMKPDIRFSPPQLQPNTEERMVDCNLVTVTNVLQTALDFFSGYQPRFHLVVDNEAHFGYTNALIIYTP